MDRTLLGHCHRVALRSLAAAGAVLALGACGLAHGPAIDTGERPAGVGGTISGIVRAAVSNAPIQGRRVTAVEVVTGATYAASTATNGGYTMKVPMGRYRLDVVLESSESVVKGPEETTINRSDLDAQRDFVIGRAPRR
jgi:hypothetical protein